MDDTELELEQARRELKRYKEAENGRKFVTALFSLLPAFLFILLFAICLGAGLFGFYFSCIACQAGDSTGFSLWSGINILGLFGTGITGVFFGYYLTRDY